MKIDGNLVASGEFLAKDELLQNFHNHNVGTSGKTPGFQSRGLVTSYDVPKQTQRLWSITRAMQALPAGALKGCGNSVIRCLTVTTLCCLIGLCRNASKCPISAQYRWLA